MREDPDIQTSFIPNVLLGSNTTSFDRLRRDPPGLLCLQAEITKDDSVATSGLTSYTPSLAFSMLDPLGHQRHRLTPRMYPG